MKLSMLKMKSMEMNNCDKLFLEKLQNHLEFMVLNCLDGPKNEIKHK